MGTGAANQVPAVAPALVDSVRIAKLVTSFRDDILSKMDLYLTPLNKLAGDNRVELKSLRDEVAQLTEGHHELTESVKSIADLAGTSNNAE